MMWRNIREGSTRSHFRLFRRVLSTGGGLMAILFMSYHYFYGNYLTGKGGSSNISPSTRNNFFGASALSIQNKSIMNPPKQSPVNNDVVRVFCYGDSLTAGTSPPSYELFPYAVHLEKSINDKIITSSSSTENNTSQNSIDQLVGSALPKVSIRWKGLPGWTANTMLEYANDSNVGLCTTIRKVHNPSLSLVIILAGTNDIGMAASSSSDSKESSKRIASDIIALHQLVFDSSSLINQSIQTLAISVPPSKWQQSSAVAQSMAEDVNNRIRAWCDATENSHFVKHPIESWSLGDRRWAPDGLHLSPMGYEEFGKSLTSVVTQILFPRNSLQTEERNSSEKELTD
jgi:lysophospholipase L1-like esterase